MNKKLELNMSKIVKMSEHEVLQLYKYCIQICYSIDIEIEQTKLSKKNRPHINNLKKLSGTWHTIKNQLNIFLYGKSE